MASTRKYTVRFRMNIFVTWAFIYENMGHVWSLSGSGHRDLISVDPVIRFGRFPRYFHDACFLRVVVIGEWFQNLPYEAVGMPYDDIELRVDAQYRFQQVTDSFIVEISQMESLYSSDVRLGMQKLTMVAILTTAYFSRWDYLNSWCR